MGRRIQPVREFLALIYAQQQNQIVLRAQLVYKLSWAREETSRKFRGVYLHYEGARVRENACSYRCECQLHSHEAACTKNAYFLRTPL